MKHAHPQPAYEWREEPCECDLGKSYASDHEGYYERRCEDCEGSGTVQASCADCRNVMPLNDEGFCEKCRDSAELPLEAFMAKYHPHVFLDGRAA